jgi:hypothetical protein
MLVFFDEAENSIDDLKKTLDSPWYGEHTHKVIIVDTTGFGPHRQNLAMQYVDSKEHKIPVVVDSSVEHEPKLSREETIRRLSKQITAPFFLAIQSGMVIKNFAAFETTVLHVASRTIHWSFPTAVGLTTVVPYKLHYGLFITKPYRTLMRIPEVESFTEQLRKEEETTAIKLSLPCWNCLLV